MATSTLTRLLVPAFLGVSLLKTLRHEMWRDELQAWLIAKDSPSLASLFSTLGYEGHPALWYLCLRLLSHVSDQPVAMQVLHVVLATAVVYAVARFAPFTLLQKVLFAFGYFPFFEYATISRAYALGVLLALASCAVWASPRRPALGVATLLVLLAQTSAQGIVVAAALGLGYATDAVLTRRDSTAPPLPVGRRFAPVAVVLLGIAGAMGQIVTPPDSMLAGHWRMDLDPERLRLTLAALWKGYAPIPRIEYHFWNTNVLDDAPATQAWLALAFLPVSLLLVASRPAALVLWASGSVGLLGFWYVKYPGLVRHHGHLFILLLLACWLASTARPWRLPGRVLRAAAALGERHRVAVVTALLLVHVVAGLFASGMDLVLPFSASRDAARFIESHFPGDVVVVGHADASVIAVAGYLNRPVYYPTYRHLGTFLPFALPPRHLEEGDLVAEVRELAARTGKGVVLVLTHPLTPSPTGFELVRRFDRAIVARERYHLYGVRPLNPGRSGRREQRARKSRCQSVTQMPVPSIVTG